MFECVYRVLLAYSGESLWILYTKDEQKRFDLLTSIVMQMQKPLTKTNVMYFTHSNSVFTFFNLSLSISLSLTHFEVEVLLSVGGGQAIIRAQ